MARSSANRLEFFIFGHNISHSLSPTIHNTAFGELGLPHHYSIHESVDIDESNVQILLSPNFGGASITFPHKLSVQPHLDSLSEAALRIGAVNTVVVESVKGQRKLRGENTDWSGILNCIRSNPTAYPRSAIVIGAGGAARAGVFALQQMGCRHISIVNRSRKTAEKLISNFPFLEFDLLSSLHQVVSATTVIIACVPADNIIEKDIPESIFSVTGGVVVEMSYRPPVSALMRVAANQPGWKVFGGIDVLKEQAYAQFELWTGQKAPVEKIEGALSSAIQKL